MVAAGRGIRLGKGEPKALIPLAGRPMLAWALDAAEGCGFARIVVTAPPERIADFQRVVGSGVTVIAGGDRRSASVRRGFEALDAAEGDVVAVHDAARPLVTPAEFAAVLEAAGRTGAAIAATSVVDTIKRVERGLAVATVDRSVLHGAATPQAFRADILRRALALGRDTTDEAALCEELGIPVAVVLVSRLAFKITTAEDLELAEAILERKRRTGRGET